MEDYTKIYDMPPLPSAIIEAVNKADGRFAVFIGAGQHQLYRRFSGTQFAPLTDWLVYYLSGARATLLKCTVLVAFPVSHYR